MLAHDIHHAQTTLAGRVLWRQAGSSNHMLSSILELVELEIAPTEILRESPIFLYNHRPVLQELDCGQPPLLLHFSHGALVELHGIVGHSDLSLCLPQRYVPDFGQARLAVWAFDIEHDHILTSLLVLMHRKPLCGISAVAEVPLPACDVAFGFVLKCNLAALHVDDLEA